jgi:isoquinoline 1-oxidoreductase subunit alpha
MTKLTLNGKPTEFKVPNDTPLLWVLRDVANMTGTKYGCGAGLCGACTVHIDGQAVRSCQTPIGDIEGASVTTIEGLSIDRSHPVQRAWIEHQVPQCGYCQSGMIMAAAALINEIPSVTEQDVIDNITNLCRCGTYPRIKKAIVRAGAIDASENPGRRKTPPPKTDIPAGMPLEDLVPDVTQ